MPSIERKSGLGYEYSMVVMMAIVWGFVGMNRIGIAFLFPIIVPLFHLNYFQAGLLISDTSGLWALSSYVGGLMGDRYGKKLVYIPAMIWAAIMSALLGVAGGFAALLVIRALIGLGDGVGASVGFSMVADISGPTRRGFNIGILSSGYTMAGVGVGAIVITRLAKSLGWQWVYPVLNIGMVIFALLLLWLMVDVWRNKKQEQKPAEAAPKPKISPFEPLKYRGFYLIILMNVFCLAWLMLSNGFNALFLTKVHHFSPVLAGSVLAGGGIAGFAGMWILSFLSDYIGRKPVVIGCGFISGILLLIFALDGSLGAGALAVLMGVIGFFAWGQTAFTVGTLIVEAVPEWLGGTAMGTSNFPSVIIGTFVLPAVGGWAADKWGIGTPVVMAAVCMLLVGFIMIFVPESAPRRVKAKAGSEIAA